jgi:hypothetical protein
MLPMKKSPASFDLVRQIGLEIPGVEESTCFGQPALRFQGRMFACIASHSSAEPGSLVVRMDFTRREELLVEAPEIYYITGHYLAYPSILARLEKIRPDELRGLLAGGLQFVQAEGRKRSARKVSRRAR